MEVSIYDYGVYKLYFVTENNKEPLEELTYSELMAKLDFIERTTGQHNFPCKEYDYTLDGDEKHTPKTYNIRFTRSK